MKYAISMYRGGQPIAASSCDHESSKKLGLICPFCSQAVFLRSGSTYENRSGKKVTVPSALCHYQSDDPLSQSCELRSQSPDGEEYIKQLEVKARNQRLELYNNRLWDAFQEGYSVNNKGLKQMRKYFNQRWVEKNAILCRKKFKELRESCKKEACQAFESSLDGAVFGRIQDRDWADSEKAKSKERWSDVDSEIQKLVLSEIVDFLATRTSRYVFQWLFELALFQWCFIWWVAEHKTPPTASGLAVEHYRDVVKRQVTEDFVKMIAHLIGGVPWVKLFYSLGDSPEVS